MGSTATSSYWLLFGAVVGVMLALDLLVLHRRSHAVSVREAGLWSAIWVLVGTAFGAWLWLKRGGQVGLEYFTAYVVEKSLSVDNLFVFVAVFSTLGIPARHQHRVLYWGVLSALLLRALMIFAGIALLERFHALVYLFGGLLVLSGVKVFRDSRRPHSEEETARKLMLRIRRRIPTSPTFDGQRFFTRVDGRTVATPLFVALAIIELTDLVFAIDSIPAVLAVTRDPFVVFTSNAFAILGLRSLYFLLAHAVRRLSGLKAGLAAVLVFVGAKMALGDFVQVPTPISLGVIALLLGGSLAGSMLRDARRARRQRDRGEPRPGADRLMEHTR